MISIDGITKNYIFFSVSYIRLLFIPRTDMIRADKSTYCDRRVDKAGDGFDVVAASFNG